MLISLAEARSITFERLNISSRIPIHLTLIALYETVYKTNDRDKYDGAAHAILQKRSAERG